MRSGPSRSGALRQAASASCGRPWRLERAAEEVHSLQIRPGVERRPSETLRSHALPQQPRSLGRGPELAGPGSIARVSPPRRDPEAVRLVQSTHCLQSVSEGEQHLVPAGRWHLRAHDLAEQRMGDAELPRRLRAWRQEASPLEPHGGVGHAERSDAGDADRLADRDELEDRALRVVQGAHPQRDEVVQPLAQLETTGPPPHPLLGPQGAGLDTVADQLPEEQRVAHARAPQEVQRAALDVPFEHGAHHGLHLRPSERLDRHQRSGSVLPEGHDRVGHRRATAHGHHRGGRALGEEQPDECGRGVVEEVRVVDAEQEASFAAIALERTDDPAQDRLAITSDGRARHQVAHRTEWHRRGGLGGHDPLRAIAGGRHPGQHVVREPGLPHAGGAGQDHAATLREGPRGEEQLVVAADEGPAAQIDIYRPVR